MPRRATVAALAAMLAAAAGTHSARAAVPASPATSGPALQGVARVIPLAGVAHPARTAAPRVASPSVVQDTVARAPERRAPHPRTVSPSTATQFLPEIVEGRLGVSQLSTLQGAQHDTQASRVSPPDTTMSASATTVAEMVNLSLLTMNHDGSNPQMVQLKDIWSAADARVGTGQFDLSDPRIVFDPGAGTGGRWFISIVYYDPNLFNGNAAASATHSWIGFAASTDATPTSWNVYSFQGAPGVLMDQPGLGVNVDKITLSANDFDYGNGGLWTGANVIAANQAQMVAGSAVSTFAIQDSTGFGYAPAVTTGSTTTATEYVPENFQPFDPNTGNPTGPQAVRIQAISGIPGVGGGASDMQFTITMCVSCGNASLTGQPGGVTQPNSATTLDPGDDRFLGSVWQSGKLWTGGSTAVTTGPESAMSIFEVDTASMTIPFDAALDSGTGESFFYPSIALDQNGTPFVAFSRASATRYASSAAGAVVGSGASVSFLTAGVLDGGAGQGPYDCMCTGGQNPTRFGDYSGSAVDPSDPSTVWVASEYSGVGDGSGKNWATLMTRVTLDAPGATSSSPGSGLTRGGTWVTVNGSSLDENSQVLFGGTPAQAVQQRGPAQLVALSPPHRAGTVDVTVVTPTGSATLHAAFTYVLPPRSGGYWLVASDGGIFPFGNAGGYGSTGNVRLNQPIVGMAALADGSGYWLVAADGGIFPFGNALNHSYGSAGGIHLNKPVVGMAPTPDGNGYWLVASDGGIFPFGDAGGYGSTGNIRLNQPIVGMAPTPTGHGYWLVASDGGIFPFGDAGGYGSTGNIHLNQPIVGMAATTDGGGYWLVASDGGIFPFGDAAGWGSTGNIHLNQPIVGMAQSGDDGGYWLDAADGGIFPFGDAAGYGSTGNIRLNQPMVGMAASQP